MFSCLEDSNLQLQANYPDFVVLLLASTIELNER